MANVKITDLSAYTNPAATDVLPIVDVAADVTKKVSIQDLMENAGSGTAALPGIAFDGDSNTGIYRPGADQVAISTNGAGRLFIDSSGNIGVGTTSPTAKLTVNGTAVIARFQSGVASDGRIEFAYNTTDIGYINAAAADRLGLIARSGVDLQFGAGGSEAARIDSSGRLLVGTPTARSNFAGNTATPLVQIEGVTAATASSSAVRGAADSVGPTFNLGKTRGESVGQHTVVVSDDQCGVITFQGADGTNLIRAAQIEAAVDGTPGTNDMPGRLVFSVTADGASSPTEAMRIKNSRILNFANTPVYADNAAAKTGGLVDGDVYRKSDGTLMIVYT